MSVRIYNDGLAGAAASEAKRAEELSRAPGAGRTPVSSPSGGEDQVSISSLSETVSASNTSMDASRAERIKYLSAVYQSGNYHVDAQQISRAIIDDSLRGGSMESDT